MKPKLCFLQYKVVDKLRSLNDVLVKHGYHLFLTELKPKYQFQFSTFYTQDELHSDLARNKKINKMLISQLQTIFNGVLYDSFQSQHEDPIAEQELETVSLVMINEKNYTTVGFTEELEKFYNHYIERSYNNTKKKEPVTKPYFRKVTAICKKCFKCFFRKKSQFLIHSKTCNGPR